MDKEKRLRKMKRKLKKLKIIKDATKKPLNHTTAKEKTKILKAAFVEAFKRNLTVISSACEDIGITRQIVDIWKKEDTEFAEKLSDLDDYPLDLAEKAHLKKIQQEDSQHILFHLRTKGRKRGYGQTVAHEGSKENPIKFEHNISDEQAKEIMEIALAAKKYKLENGRQS